VIHLFSSDGKYIDSLERKGKGPGEFLQIDPKSGSGRMDRDAVPSYLELLTLTAI
jgi:hypothetical protein